MKKLALLAFVFSSVMFTSCEKEENDEMDTHTSTPATRDINVEYRITNESGNVVIEYIAPGSGSTALTTQTVTINRTYTSIAFPSTNNNFFSVKSWNVDPSWKSITVDIYVDGHLFRSGSNDHTTTTASTSGIVE